MTVNAIYFFASCTRNIIEPQVFAVPRPQTILMAPYAYSAASLSPAAALPSMGFICYWENAATSAQPATIWNAARVSCLAWAELATEWPNA